MNIEREVGLRELTVTILEHRTSIGGDAVAGDGHILKGALADHCALRVEGRNGHLQRARLRHVWERVCLVNHQVVTDALLALAALGDAFEGGGVEVVFFLNNLKFLAVWYNILKLFLIFAMSKS